MTPSRTGQDAGVNGRIKLNQVLAIVVRKEGCQTDPGDFWMYENGYLLFQGLLSSNSVCWWNNALNGATKNLTYYGYVNPGAILVGSEPCAIEVLRNAWAKRVLQPPPGYQIIALEDIEDCSSVPVLQTQWTPLPEAVCAVILRLSSQGRPAGIETIREALILAFPHVSPPSEQALYDTLVHLTKERKLYNTSSGYYIVTPEKKRSRSQSRTRTRKNQENAFELGSPSRTMLMSTEEAMAMVHGDISTTRDGNVTHQCIQTNLADVICGGNASDKIMYPRPKRRSSSFPTHRSPDRKGSFRLWSSSRRLRRSASTRTIHKHYVDTSSSTDYPNSGESTPTPKKESLLSRIFRRSKRSQCQIGTFGAQFPPTEWFNSKTVHLHSVGTQTSAKKDSEIDICAYLEACDISSRSTTLPRRHRRQLSSEVIVPTSLSASRENSPVSRAINSSCSSSTLPRKHGLRNRDGSSKGSKSTLGKPSARATDSKNESSPRQTLETVNISSHVTSEGVNDNKNIVDSSTSQDASERIDSASPAKNFLSIDNSGPSSIESHKSSRTGSSITSGPSSLESHKTVIDMHKSDIKSRKKQIKKEITRTRISAKSNDKISSGNLFTLEVTTNQNGVNIGQSNSKAKATINNGPGSSTKIFVQSSPVRSVVTFENGHQSENGNSNVVVINGDVHAETHAGQEKPSKNTNRESQASLNNIKDDSVHIENSSETMNNSRKLSLQLPSKDSLNYHNLIKNVPSSYHNQYVSCSNPDSPVTNSYTDFPKNFIYGSSPSSPTKSFDCTSYGKFFKNGTRPTVTHEKFSENKLLDKNSIGSEPNICHKEKSLSRENSRPQFPSLSDLSLDFTSLAAQKILNGVSINSIDTLVELDMAANTSEKQKNRDVAHTDFGLF